MVRFWGGPLRMPQRATKDVLAVKGQVRLVDSIFTLQLVAPVFLFYKA